MLDFVFIFYHKSLSGTFTSSDCVKSNNSICISVGHSFKDTHLFTAI